MGRHARDPAGEILSRATPFLLGLFFGFAALVTLGVGTALLWPDSVAQVLWSLYEARRALLMPYRAWLGPGFVLLGLVMTAASFGCFARRPWGRWLACAIFAVNGLSDIVQLAAGNVAEGAVGVTAAGLLLYWLTRPPVKDAFA